MITMYVLYKWEFDSWNAVLYFKDKTAAAVAFFGNAKEGKWSLEEFTQISKTGETFTKVLYEKENDRDEIFR